MTPELAPLLYAEIKKIAGRSDWTPGEKVLSQAQLLERVFVESTRKEQLAFNTLFARICYAGHRYQIPENTLLAVHTFRKRSGKVRQGAAAAIADVQLGTLALAQSTEALTQRPVPDDVADLFPRVQDWQPAHRARTGFLAECRVLALHDDPEGQCLVCLDEEDPHTPIRVRYGLTGHNEQFQPTLTLIRKIFGFPIALNLLEVDIDDQGDYRPKAWVTEPDFLVDITAISECFKEHGAEPLYYLVKKFLPYETSVPMLLGNIANFFLDQLLQNPDAPYPQLFRETFSLFPLVYAPLGDDSIRKIHAGAQKHYLNIRQMAVEGLQKQDIQPDQCVLEPAFFSKRYGIQGRLDLFYRNADKNIIVELKSGQPFRPNSYGIQRSHFTQTLLYDLLVRSVYPPANEPVKYILYSGAELNPLRFAPTIVPEQMEAIQVRNQLVALERMLCQIKPGALQVPVLNKLNKTSSAGKGFLQRDFAAFENTYANLPPLEKKYFNSFVGFLARENHLAKIGDPETELQDGTAALWRQSYQEKIQNFSILNDLVIVENQADQPVPLIVFQTTEQTCKLANFRTGDIAVLYPGELDSDTVLNHQVIRCNIISLETDRVVVQLRFSQSNLNPFTQHQKWRLEPDFMENSFVSMYRSLFEWASSPPDKRRFCIIPENTPAPTETAPAHELRIPSLQNATDEQRQVFGNIVRSSGFYLLWGPPGTGKTSIMLRAMAEWILTHTPDNALLLAYTNRAVDEICDALDSLGGQIRDQYLRIGSRFSTAPPYRDQLLQTQMTRANNRNDLLHILHSRRIFVGTVASFAQNDQLLRLKKFQRLVVDEASQILEPQIIGLIARFDHFTLIGDHKQLPAISLQTPEYARVNDDALREIGLTDLRNSYFERLYRLCEIRNRTQNFGKLSRQGRMHREIMAFPNEFFYGNMLQPLAGTNTPTDKQSAPADHPIAGVSAQWDALLRNKRVAFIPAPTRPGAPGPKTNPEEARIVASLVKHYQALYRTAGLPWDPAGSLGVITPWRAQIAQIRTCLYEEGLDPDDLTIDTVERYQGGARDIIIVSTCVNEEYQLQSLVNLSAEGVDRKLNVALTRARNHLILIGNQDILEKDERYHAFIRRYRIG